MHRFKILEIYHGVFLKKFHRMLSSLEELTNICKWFPLN